MRDYEDDYIRLYKPYVRWGAVLVAVAAMVPMALWTVSAFTRSDTGTKRQATAVAAAIPQTSEDGTNDADAPPPSLSARAKPIESIPVVGDAKAAAAAANDQGPRTNTAAAPVWPTPGPSNAKVAEQRDSGPVFPVPSAMPRPDQPSSPSSESSADALPAAPPITGPIPMPKQRPRILAMLERGVPMPRPRPATAATDEGDQQQGGLTNFFHGLFQPQQPTPQQPGPQPQ